jgi:LPS sulfotransferase NodH
MIVILGPYRCGSSAIAQVLSHLGVEMGGLTEHYENKQLAEWLRGCWDEPWLNEKVTAAERVQWLRTFGDKIRGAMKHPLLSLCTKEIEAIELPLQWVSALRPIEESITSLQNISWWPNCRELQERLYDEREKFLMGREHVPIQFGDLKANPARQIVRLVQRLGLTPTNEQMQAAVECVRKDAHP